jgi:hypothetical protein
MYTQDKVAGCRNEVFYMLDKGAHIYFCGLKGVMPGDPGYIEEDCREQGGKLGRKIFCCLLIFPVSLKVGRSRSPRMCELACERLHLIASG